MEKDSLTISELLESNLNLIRFFAGRLKKPDWLTQDEYEAELLLAIYRSAQTFDPAIAKFSTYAYHGMRLCRQGIMDKRGRGKESLYARSIYKADGSTIDVEDRCDPGKRENAAHAENVVGKLLKSLDGNRKRVVLLRLEGNTLDEIGEILKCSRQRVSDIYSSAISRLKGVASMNGIVKEDVL